MFSEQSSMFQMAFVQIPDFDCLPGRQKGYFLEKNLKSFLLGNHKVNEAVTFHTWPIVR